MNTSSLVPNSMTKYIPNLLKLLRSCLYSISNSKIKKSIQYDMLLLYKDYMDKKDITKNMIKLLKTLKPNLKYINNEYKRDNLKKLLIYFITEVEKLPVETTN